MDRGTSISISISKLEKRGAADVGFIAAVIDEFIKKRGAGPNHDVVSGFSILFTTEPRSWLCYAAMSSGGDQGSDGKVSAQETAAWAATQQFVQQERATPRVETRE